MRAAAIAAVVVPLLWSTALVSATKTHNVKRHYKGERKRAVEYTLDKRADSTQAGFGLELEWRGVKLYNCHYDYSTESGKNRIGDYKNMLDLVDNVKQAQWDDLPKECPNQGTNNPIWAVFAEHYDEPIKIDYKKKDDDPDRYKGSEGIGYLTVESIIDGKQVALKDIDKIKGYLDDIQKCFDAWAPQNPKSAGLHDVKGTSYTTTSDSRGVQKTFTYSRFGQWFIESPSKYVKAAITWGSQITVAMSLEGIQQLFHDYKVDPDDLQECDQTAFKAWTDRKVLQTDVTTKKDNIHEVRVDDFKAFTDKSPSLKLKLTDAVLGFFSLVVSYAKASHAVNPGSSPKQTLPIMPRTDFVTLYKESGVKDLIEKDDAFGFLRKTSKAQLYDVVTELAKVRNNQQGNEDDSYADTWKGLKFGMNREFPTNRDISVNLWINSLQGVPTQDPYWGGKTPDPVDLLTTFDKGIDSQIGGLGSKLEPLLKGDGGVGRKVPIFELRDMGAITGDTLSTQIPKKITQIQLLHKTYQDASTGTSKISARDLSKRADSCARPPTQSSSTSSTPPTTTTSTTPPGPTCDDS